MFFRESVTVIKKGRGRPAKVYRLRAPDGKLYDDTSGNLYGGQSLLPLNLPGTKSVEKVLDDTSKQQCEIEPKGVVMADPLSNDGDLHNYKSGIKEVKQTDGADLNAVPSIDHQEAKQDAQGLGQDMGTQGTVTGSDRSIAIQQKTVTDEEMVLVPPTGEENTLHKQLSPSDLITKDMIPDLPVFTTEEEKITFEETLNQIDMTQVSNHCPV